MSFQNKFEENLIFNHCSENDQLIISKTQDNSYNIECIMDGVYQSIDIQMSKEQLIEMAKTIVNMVK